MKGAFRAASRRQKSKSSSISIGVNAKERASGSTERHPEPVNHKKEERMERRTTRPAADAGLPTHPGNPLKISESSNQRNWIPGMQGWTPDVRRPDPRGTRPQDPASRTRTKDFAEARTSWDLGLHGIQDYVGSLTLWDSRLRKT